MFNMEEPNIDTALPIAERLLMEDGFLSPVAFLCTQSGNVMVELADEAEILKNALSKNDINVVNMDPLFQTLETVEAHKVILVTEIKKFTKPDDISDDMFESMIHDDIQRSFLDIENAFTIAEVSSDNVKIYMRSFKHNNNSVVFNDDERLFYDDNNIYNIIQKKLTPALIC